MTEETIKFFREKYLEEDKETLVERILILEDVNWKLVKLINKMNDELDLKIRELNEVIKEMDK